MGTYRIIEISDSIPELPEQLGTKKKFWFHLDNTLYLFKIGRPGTGENWSEKAAAELCKLLGLPCASYELATWKGNQGVLTPLLFPKDAHLFHGNEVLTDIAPGYPVEKKFGNRDHTLNRIHALLLQESILPPLDWQPPDRAIKTAFDVFIGYLLLDTWIANQDRHHENWGLITYQKYTYLSPTFDHAVSLGYNLRDCERKDRLTTRDKRRTVEYYAQRARSAIYESRNHKKPLHTLDAFIQAAQKRPRAAEVWLDRLCAVKQEDCRLIFNAFPDGYISSFGKDFALSLLRHNRERLLNSVSAEQ
uniref:phosphatidylinositol kinase n=1 Tax=Candidatus Electrothrix sp. TaxID=2170559 RepID=UPI00405794BA